MCHNKSSHTSPVLYPKRFISTEPIDRKASKLIQPLTCKYLFPFTNNIFSTAHTPQSRILRWHLFVKSKSIFVLCTLKFAMTRQIYKSRLYPKLARLMTLYKWFLGLFASHNNLINSSQRGENKMINLAVTGWFFG